MCFSSTCSHVVSLRRTAWKRHTVPGRGGLRGGAVGKGHKRCSVFAGKRERGEGGMFEWRSKSLN